MSDNLIEGVSVIVCCYNSAARLQETLKHLSLQNVPLHIKWEVIVVDNNSTDNTSEEARLIWKNFNNDIPFKILQESRLGLTYARRSGAKQAQYELLLFCDDDNWLEENYIMYGFSIMQEHQEIGILGGKSEGVFEGTKPDWFDRFQKAYVIGQPLPQSGLANESKYIGGAGMLIRKTIWQLMERLSLRQMLSDRKGNELSSGGDVELCMFTMFLGYDLYFDDRLLLKHFMPARRLSWNYCVEMISKGHSIPQIYFDLYFYCYNQLINKREVVFKEGYRMVQAKLIKKLLQHLKRFWHSFKWLIKEQPGSGKEIEVKAIIHKLKYLLKQKQELKNDFYIMQETLHKIMSINKSN